MELGSFWETAANFATAITAFVAFLTVWYRYKSSTPLEKLFMEGADRVLLQVGTIVEYLGIVILWVAAMNACGLWISSLPLSNMLNKKLTEILKADGSDIYSHIFAMLGLLFLLVWMQTFISKSDSNDFHMDEKTMSLAEKSESVGFDNLIKSIIIPFKIPFEILIIVVLIYTIHSRFIYQKSIVFIPIKITLDLVVDVLRHIRCGWIWKLINKYTFAKSSSLGMILCFFDAAYLWFYLRGVDKGADDFWLSLVLFILCFIAFCLLGTKANELKGSNSEYFCEFKNEYIAISLVVFGVVLVPYFLMHNGLDMFNIMACITGNDKSSLSVNMNNIIMILLVEMVVMLLSFGGVKSIKTRMNFQDVTMRLVILSTGKPWFAYRVYDGQLVYGDDREYKNQSSSHFISMDDVYNGKYALTDANIEPQEFYSVKVLIKGMAESNIDSVIDVSTKKARRNKGYNFIDGSKFDDSLGESGYANISLIKDRVSNERIDKIDKNSRILVYCEVEKRLQVAAWRLIAMGYKSVYICKARKYCRWSWDGKALCAEFALRK